MNEIYKKLISICEKYDIKIGKYEKTKEIMKILKLEDFSKKYKACSHGHEPNFYAIFFDDKMSPFMKNYVISHEIGHVLMGHLSPEVDHKHMNLPSGEIAYGELLADVFACVMTAMNVLSKGGKTDDNPYLGHEDKKGSKVSYQGRSIATENAK